MEKERKIVGQVLGIEPKDPPTLGRYLWYTTELHHKQFYFLS